MKDFLESLGITQTGNITDDGNYLIDFKKDDEWSKANSKLQNSSEVVEIEDASTVAMEAINIQYSTPDNKYLIIMTADFDADTYKLICKEN